jgi:hypothetical protein
MIDHNDFDQQAGDPERWSQFMAIPRRDLMERYYVHNLTAVVEEVFAPDITNIIVEYAADGFAIGVKLDALDSIGQWCLGQVVAIRGDLLKIHFVGFSPKWDEWISFFSKRIAPLWSRTLKELEDRNVNSLLVNVHSPPTSVLNALRSDGIPDNEIDLNLPKLGNRFVVIDYFHRKEQG